jgi:uncharacterized membrane protein YfhO
MTSFTNNKIKGIIELKENKLLFFSIPFDKGWHCLIDGKQTEPILSNIGFCGIELMPGRHNIELFYEPPFFKVSFIATLVGLLLYMLVIFIKQYNYKKTSQSQKITISDNSQL